MNEFHKIPQSISNPISDNLLKLAKLFPSAVKDGELDVDALKEELGEVTEVGQEKYELTWTGKASAKKIAREDMAGRTLKFVPQDSKNADTTENLYIEGDNLEVLKLLRQNYYGAIKMIYIDPPYNTGNDFVYRDNFNMAANESSEAEGETKDGERLIANQKSSNRYHANWLNMMYPRLKVAKDLLREDGVIFISIDDNEVKNLRALCDEIFGEENFVAQIPWQSRKSIQNDTDLSKSHEYILSYARNRRQKNRRLKESNYEVWFKKDSFVCQPLLLDKENFSNPDGDVRGLWKADPFDAPNIRPNLTYAIVNPNTGQEYLPPHGRHWRTGQDNYLQLLKDNRIVFGKKGESKPQLKVFYDEKIDFGSVDNTWFNAEKIGTTTKATDELQNIFDGVAYFDTPKPTSLIKKLFQLSGVTNDDMVIDFFSGSSTTAHAVMQLNTEDGGNRKFIMVQYPEECKEDTEANKAGFKNICEIGKERIRRAGEKIKTELVEKQSNKQTVDDIEITPIDPENLDIGFKVFRVGNTNIRWTHEALHSNEFQVDENILTDKDRLDFMLGYTDLDVVYEVLLHQHDIPLSAKVKKLQSIGKRTYIFADSYVVCLEETITRDMVEKIATIEPLPIKFIMRDSAFEDDIAFKDETVRRLQALIARSIGEMKTTYTVEFI